ncbi:hypothetical protein MSPP1_002696 [Malassezia sp. CBS 17886]|nr:hypothetical protein MSPP1_002696 [Malassezia sp. CBS 17886]
MDSVLAGVWESVFHEGVNSPTHNVMNVAFCALFLTLLGLLVATGGNGHVIALLFLSAGLFLAINWFISELCRERARQQKEE